MGAAKWAAKSDPTDQQADDHNCDNGQSDHAVRFKAMEKMHCALANPMAQPPRAEGDPKLGGLSHVAVSSKGAARSVAIDDGGLG